MILFTDLKEAVEHTRKFNVVCKGLYVDNSDDDACGALKLHTIGDMYNIENADVVALDFVKNDEVVKSCRMLLPTDMLPDFFSQCEAVLISSKDKAVHLVDGKMEEVKCADKAEKMINSDDDMIRFMHDAHLLASVCAGHSDVSMKMGIALRESKIDGSMLTVAVAIGVDKKMNKELKPLSMVISDEYAPTLLKNLESGKVTTKDSGICTENITHVNGPTSNKVVH